MCVNVHAPSEEKSDDVKVSFYEELEQVFDHFPKYHMKMLLGDVNAKVGRENIFKPTIRQESLHHGSNDNGFRLVNFATSQNLVVKNTIFLTGTFINTPGPPLIVILITRLTTY